jgi:hypothetical protein
MAQGRKYDPMPLAGEVIDAEFRREDRAAQRKLVRVS